MHMFRVTDIYCVMSCEAYPHGAHSSKIRWKYGSATWHLVLWFHDRCPGMTHPDKMPTRAQWRALSVVLILLWGHPRAALACPYPCACYVPSEVHCTFRSLASVPAGISKHVERINLGFVPRSFWAIAASSHACWFGVSLCVCAFTSLRIYVPLCVTVSCVMCSYMGWIEGAFVTILNVVLWGLLPELIRHRKLLSQGWITNRLGQLQFLAKCPLITVL